MFSRVSRTLKHVRDCVPCPTPLSGTSIPFINAPTLPPPYLGCPLEAKVSLYGWPNAFDLTPSLCWPRPPSIAELALYYLSCQKTFNVLMEKSPFSLWLSENNIPPLFTNLWNSSERKLKLLLFGQFYPWFKYRPSSFNLMGDWKIWSLYGHPCSEQSNGDLLSYQKEQKLNITKWLIMIE